MNRGLNDPTAGIDLNQPTIELSDEEIDAFRTKVGEIAGLVSEYLTDMFDINSSINQSEGEVTGLITVHHPGTQPMGTQISAGSIKQEHGEVMPDSQKEEIAQTLTAATVMHLQQNNESGQDVPAS